MPQPISDYKLFFANARQAVEELDGLIFEEKQLTEEAKDIGADIEYEQKLCEDTIASDIEKNRNNICRQYDDIIKKQKADFKKVSAEREKAKNQGIKDRISEETADLRAENRNLQVMIREMFVSNKVPEFCNTDIYYSLYFPNKFTDYLIIVTAALISFAVLPAIIYFLLPDKAIHNLIIIVLADIIIFGGGYLITANLTMVKNLSILKDAAILRNDIDENIKRIRVIAKSIVNDNDEKKYDLANFDDELAHIERDLQETNRERKEALNSFDKVKQNIIIDEINARFQPEIDRLNKLYADTEEELRVLRAKLEEKQKYLEENFEVYLGAEFLDVEKIDILDEIMDKSLVINLDEAIEEYKNQMEE